MLVKRILFVAFALGGMLQVRAQSAKHVVLISIDGLRPEFYLDPAWPAPHLRQLKQQGVYARQVVGVFPTVTYPSHTSIVTGQPPGKHGIYYNTPFEAPKGRWYWEDSSIKTPTLWKAVKHAGLTSGAVMWPVTVGAPIDYNFPVRRADGDEKTDQLSVTRPYITPAGMLDQMAAAGNGTVTADDFKYRDVDRTIGRMGAFIFKQYQPALLAIHFIQADHAQHEHGRDAPEVKTAVAVIDSMIGRVIAAVEESGQTSNTTIIVTGDHGFVDATQSVAPNVLLEKNGLISGDDWKAKFYTTGGSAFLYTKKAGDAATTQQVEQLLRQLPHGDQWFRIVTKKELEAIGANPEVELALAMKKGFVASNAIKGPLIRTKPLGGAHGYYPDFDEIYTGFIAAGNGIKKGSTLARLRMLDIAPVICRLLGIPPIGNGTVALPDIFSNR
ncbi:ectonucleotide pyrophosphatase/phosphodiesterase [Niabella pedocola]|uniref:Ectonucleotide pyrophosphatase/phosphodiesterase n=1 Tax=Niabella pedocola TaxID=1752077 RepID=A0ABS8PSZ9_9BACT|nr:ectonucleotide pyrophosphatase/phosphodiesterase [Niabella pedocola]MCD2423036.1 ectonucleotide pyrophosphatase/phosphodiesterase [Niabella pedocola]